MNKSGRACKGRQTRWHLYPRSARVDRETRWGWNVSRCKRIFAGNKWRGERGDTPRQRLQPFALSLTRQLRSAKCNRGPPDCVLEGCRSNCCPFLSASPLFPASKLTSRRGGWIAPTTKTFAQLVAAWHRQKRREGNKKGEKRREIQERLYPRSANGIVTISKIYSWYIRWNNPIIKKLPPNLGK